jgi:hypothetical protein
MQNSVPHPVILFDAKKEYDGRGMVTLFFYGIEMPIVKAFYNVFRLAGNKGCRLLS